MGSISPPRALIGTKPDRNVEVVETRSPDQIGAVASLVREFVAWARVRHGEKAWAVDLYFDRAELEAELATLGERYAPPHGALLLALVDGEPAACVVLDRLDKGICRMRRMFVRESVQGLGIGRRLATSLIALARDRGYRTMRLETSIYLHEAQALYRSLGFRTIPPYIDMPEALRPLSVFMELEL
ncbi:MAG TPA: GNAT family N-acetyltransferase [Alphaproteobacteria bacterium]|nr:GNAT family N-acetyltransferase [Alphaproteobacteria bacterium]